MSIRKHSDYNSYLTKLKYSNYFNNVSQNLSLIYDQNNNYNKTDIESNENIYNSYNSIGTKIGITSYNTFIVNPLDGSIPILHSVYTLQATKNIPDGFVKRIINTCPITPEKTIRIICVNENKIGSFNNIGYLFNSYIFSSDGDSLELVWSSINNYWCVQKYGGVFRNILD
jgi:hypothetical protein